MKVFLSHGHNESVALKLRQFLSERLKIIPVILSEQPDDGLTIIEKLERYGKDCDFAIVLLTADDETVAGGVRARQNVVHELGFFHGALGRDRVLLIKQQGVELFSNISGLIYKEFPEHGVQLIYEDIRLAIENTSASRVGKEVPQIGQPNEARLADRSEVLSAKIKSLERLHAHLGTIRAPNERNLVLDIGKKEFRALFEKFISDMRAMFSDVEVAYLKNRLLFAPDLQTRMDVMIGRFQDLETERVFLGNKVGRGEAVDENRAMKILEEELTLIHEVTKELVACIGTQMKRYEDQLTG